MHSEKITDVISGIISFHTLVIEYYKNQHERTNNEKLKITFQYLIKREEKVLAILNELKTENQDIHLKQWIKFSTCDEKLKMLKTMTENNSSSLDDIISFIIDIHDCMINILEELMEHTKDNKLKKILENLISLEKQEEKISIRDVSMYNEM